MPVDKRARSSITRSGTRRLGDEYQDLVALDVLVEWLEHAERYEWVQVEADDAGALDDVVVRKCDGTLCYLQSKFAAHPDQLENTWTWKRLLEQKTGAKGQLLPSLLQNWATSLQQVTASGEQVDAALHSNRAAADEILQARRLDDATLLDFMALPPYVRERNEAQLGSEKDAQLFFQRFHFRLYQPHLPDLEGALWRRFSHLGGTREGWLSLKTELRFWVCYRNEPAPDGRIRLADVRRSALWDELEGLTQEYAIPGDYVLPEEGFFQKFTEKVVQPAANCIVLCGSPGIGKSTFISYLYTDFVPRSNTWPYH